ncbi:segregation/condensation protein A [Patescibacteria group bacterium]|nr:segregation/condensation protein A [Patescibacteria group bacterium]MBU1034731.1 segregation/condensation protein A [Patescibacteria group bacterium]MBU1907849.1 segregation/condensation protein A [Patescibacteria group bacterium]
MAVTFRVEHFEGPLDLLLQLVEQERLDISEISLAAVAEQFVLHVQGNKEIIPEELADFLVVAARLMYLKSKLLIPSLFEPELEDGPFLETQLREYKKFVTASRLINEIWNSEKCSFPSRERTLQLSQGCFIPPVGVTTEDLRQMMRRVIARLEPILKLPETSIKRAINIQQKIADLFQRIKRHSKTTFKDFLAGTKDRTETVVSFLALLELVKQKFVMVEQDDIFNDIVINLHPDAPQADPLVESFA